MKYTFLLFTLFLSLPNIIRAQDNNLCYITLFMTADDEKVERAKLYKGKFKEAKGKLIERK